MSFFMSLNNLDYDETEVKMSKLNLGAVLASKRRVSHTNFKYWVGEVPEMDDFGFPIEGVFIDGRTRRGPWAMMSTWSYMEYGVGLGTGRGQQYEKQRDGRWLKTEG